MAKGLAAGALFASFFGFFFDGAAADEVAGEEANHEDDGDVEEVGGGHGLFPGLLFGAEFAAVDGLLEAIFEFVQVVAGGGADGKKG